MQEDEQLLRNVRDELGWDPAVDHGAIHVVVQDGVVILSGTVTSHAAKLAAEKAAHGAFGIRGVFDGITVGNDPEATDEAILARVRAMLELDAAVPAHTLEAAVENGHATLSGTVDWEYQREAARSAAGRVRGVTGVTTHVQVSGIPSIADIRGRVVTALQQAAEADAATIRIELDGSTVRLEGTLPSAHERDIAEAAARAAPGVADVEDRIEIA